MKLASRQDVEAPIGKVFALVSDFDGFARQAMRRGAEVHRREPQGAAQAGSSWDVRFTWRGRERRFVPTVTHWDPPAGYALHSVSGGLTVLCQMDLVPLTPARTRIALRFDLTGNGITARLFVQSLKLARGRMQQRLDQRLKDFCTGIDGQRR